MSTKKQRAEVPDDLADTLVMLADADYHVGDDEARGILFELRSRGLISWPEPISCTYCGRVIQHRGSARTAGGRDLERFERIHRGEGRR